MGDFDDEDMIGNGIPEQVLQPIAPLSPIRPIDGPRPDGVLGELPEGEEEEKNDEKNKRKKGHRVLLNEERVMGKNGIVKLPIVMKNVKFRGKGHEKDDLNLLLGKIEHWAHQMMPRQQFCDVADKLEILGSKAAIRRHAHGVKTGTIVLDDDGVIKDTFGTPQSDPAVNSDRPETSPTLVVPEEEAENIVVDKTMKINDDINNLLQKDFPGFDVP